MRRRIAQYIFILLIPIDVGTPILLVTKKVKNVVNYIITNRNITNIVTNIYGIENNYP